MSGLTIFKKICKCLNSYEYTDEYKKGKKIIERELKVNKILKKKRVDLRFIAHNRPYFDIKELTLEYNSVLFGNTTLKLTEEEMALIVEWLKGE